MAASGARVNWQDKPLEDPGVLAARGRITAGLGDLLARGVVAGTAAGLVFLVVQMGYGVEFLHQAAVAPLLAMSTVFHNTDVPTATSNDVVVGLVTHLTLSMLFGIAFAALVPLLRVRIPLLFVGGAVAGFALYLFNFQVLGRIVFKFFTNPLGPPTGLEIFDHILFGVLLVPFFVGMARRYDAAN